MSTRNRYKVPRNDKYFIVYSKGGELIQTDGILSEDHAMERWYSILEKDPHATLTHEFPDGSELMYDYKRNEWVTPITYIERYA